MRHVPQIQNFHRTDTGVRSTTASPELPGRISQQDGRVGEGDDGGPKGESIARIRSCLRNLTPSQNRLALNALTTHDAKEVLTSRESNVSMTQNYSIKIEHEGGPITNQRSSGRCWLFAATNVFRVAVMNKHNLKKFELSQSYLFYWDKLEKANYFLEQILDTAEEDLSGRMVQTLLKDPVGDGGQWDMVANLVQKYGLVRIIDFDKYDCRNSC